MSKGKKISADVAELMRQLVEAGWTNRGIENGLKLRRGKAGEYRRLLGLPGCRDVKRGQINGV